MTSTDDRPVRRIEEGLDARLDALRRDVPLRHDLWPQIAADLRGDTAMRPQHLPSSPVVKARRWWIPAAVAASTALASVTLWLHRPQQAPVPSSADVRSPSPITEQPTFSQVRAALQPGFVTALTDLEPDTRARVLQNLEIIRKAEADIAAALAEDPSNPLLLELRQRTHEHEVDLMTSLPPIHPGSLEGNET